jgi:hypothetical protein
MRRRLLPLAGLVLVGMLTGCTTLFGEGASEEAAEPAPVMPDPPATSGTPVPDSPVESSDPAARERVEGWLAAAALPPGAERISDAPEHGLFHSWYGWPCTPVEELDAYWTIDGADVGTTVTWLSENPTPGMVVPVPIILPPGDEVSDVSIGQVPEPGVQEGIVYSVAKADGGVVVRAQMAALAANATCPSLPPGTEMGGVGQG